MLTTSICSWSVFLTELQQWMTLMGFVLLLSLLRIGTINELNFKAEFRSIRRLRKTVSMYYWCKTFPRYIKFSLLELCLLDVCSVCVRGKCKHYQSFSFLTAAQSKGSSRLNGQSNKRLPSAVVSSGRHFPLLLMRAIIRLSESASYLRSRFFFFIPLILFAQWSICSRQRR